MTTAMPLQPHAWLAEMAAAMARADADLADCDEAADPDSADWRLSVEEQAVMLAREARGLGQDRSGLERALAGMDAITDLTLGLRRHAPGDPDDHHVTELQHFLLYWLAAHMQAGLLTEPQAGALVRECWLLEDGGDDEQDHDEDDELAVGGDDDEPWPVQRPAPTNTEAWFEEILSGWKRGQKPLPIRCEDGPWLPRALSQLDNSVAHLVATRQIQAPAEALRELVAAIETMSRDIDRMGPELKGLRQVPPLAFALYYLWAHILIGHLDEDHAMAVVQSCAANIERFR